MVEPYSIAQIDRIRRLTHECASLRRCLVASSSLNAALFLLALWAFFGSIFGGAK